LSAEPPRRFGFVQWEFAGRVGPEPGRYVVRRFAGDDVRQVLVLTGAAAPRRSWGRRRARRTEPGPQPVDVTRATVIGAEPLADAHAWLAAAVGPRRDEVVGEALAVLARAVAAQRVAAEDPFAADPDPARAIVTRVGYGDGDAVADGSWEVARELPAGAPPRRRRRLLAPQERVAALLGGRDAALATEELALRARADLARGRGREAALQLDVALRAALAELEGWRGQHDMGARLDELAGHTEAVAAAAATALKGGLDAEQEEAVATALGRLEAALRARTMAASGG
jgi:hypothetical protein